MTKSLRTLGSFAHVKVGYQTRTRIQEIPNGSHQLIQGKDFDSQRLLHPDKLMKFSPERNPALYEVHKGDVLIQARGLEHFAYCLTQSLENTLAAGTFYIIRIKDKSVRPAYLAWWINQTPAQSYLTSQAVKSGISFVSKNTAANLPVKVPPLEVQDKIEKIVELWQREQALQNRLTARKDRLIAALCLKSIEV